MWRSRRAPRRGFTLLEMMVSMVTMTIVLAAIAATFIATQRAYQHESQAKMATESARQANAYLDGLLKLAGYGIDPRFAFDFSTPNGLVKNNQDLTASLPPGSPQVVTDDLAFRYRNPGFLARGYLSNTSTVTLEGSTTWGVPLRAGQPLIIACRGGTDYLVVRTTAAVAADGTTASVAAYGDPFVTANGVKVVDPAPSCATSSTDFAYVMLMHEVRVRVRVLGAGADARPFLVVSNSLAAGEHHLTGTNFDPIAADVENFQVAYLMNRGTGAAVDAAGNSNWILGDHASDPLPVSNLATAGALPPTYDQPYDHGNRFNRHAANIRGVRVTIVARSLRSPVRNATAPFAVENWTPASTNPDGHYRSVTLSSVRLSNMTSRTFFTPPLRDLADAASVELNYSGG